MDQPWHRATNPDEDDNTMNCGFERIQPCEEWRGRAKEASARGSGGKSRTGADRAKRSERTFARDGGGLRKSDDEASGRARRS